MGNSHRQTVHTHRSYDHQAAKLVAALLRVARVTAGLAESNGNLYRRVYDSRHLQADHQELGSAPEPCWAIEYGLPVPFLQPFYTYHQLRWQFFYRQTAISKDNSIIPHSDYSLQKFLFAVCANQFSLGLTHFIFCVCMYECENCLHMCKKRNNFK